MTGEGEFKDRVHKDSHWTGYSNPETDYLWIKEDKVRKLVDKARQDFPKINTICLYESDDNYKVLKWFVKWFGGESK
jgi:hypothetical protein